jgi:hypothetical protein
VHLLGQEAIRKDANTRGRAALSHKGDVLLVIPIGRENPLPGIAPLQYVMGCARRHRSC